MNKWAVFFFVSIFSLGVTAQETNRYVVFLKDKLNTPYSITQPEEFLSTKSIARNGRDIIQKDLPVTPSYISQLKNNGALILGTTKWLNAALISINESNLASINSLPFVVQIEYVAPGTKPTVGGRVAVEEELEDISASNEVLAQHNMLNSDVMHTEGYYGEGMLIAVLDGGFTNVDQISYFSHLYDNQQIWDAHNFVTNGPDIYNYSDHGTEVLSTMAALGADYEGIATKANYLLYVTEAAHDYTDEKGSFEYRIEEYNWLLAAERADSIGVDIIATSLGYTDFDLASMDYTHDDLNGNTAIITIAAEEAYKRGIMVVASAGNSGNITPPADGEHVLTIGSVDSEQAKSNSSSIGPINGNWIKPDLMAMGQRTIIIGQSGNLITGNGTSFAAPQVASLVAGIWEKYPMLTPGEIIDILRKSANRAESPNDIYGYGVPSYQGFVNYLEKQKLANLDFLSIFPNPITGEILNITVNDPNSIQQLDLVIFTTDGKQVLKTSQESITWASNPIEIPISYLPKGIYIVKMKTSEHTVTKRIVKQ